MTQKAPALFVGHGSPMNAIEETDFSRGWRAVAARFPKPRAVLCVSAHWVTDGVRVMGNPQPKTIHDFRGFPPELHAVQYPAPGAPELAARVASLLTEFGAAVDNSWGFDHGNWSVLRWMYPNADVPVLQLSLDRRRQAPAHYAVAQTLAPLRDEGVAIIATGNIVHNLRAFFSGDSSLQAPSKQFDDFILDRVAANDAAAVTAYATHPAAAIAAPDWDHFFPLFYALGARAPDERAEIFNRSVATGISMTSIGFGLTPAAELAA
ncbi:MAG TPA: 4,5-DOPA dioxygenase extradiol [Caulobacterales bacterium]|nr:4,5-DOPA dioxygenase extradiol [Caulobacterales bacterium]